MPDVIKIPVELTQFQLPPAVQDKIEEKMDHKDSWAIVLLTKIKQNILDLQSASNNS